MGREREWNWWGERVEQMGRECRENEWGAREWGEWSDGAREWSELGERVE